MKWAGLFLISAGVAACECNEARCVPGVFMTVDGSWTEGQYDVSFDFDGQMESCRIVVDPAKPVEDRFLTTCSEGISGHLLNYREASFQYGRSLPEKVKLRIVRAETELLASEFEPDYETHHPNGALCDGSCESAGASFMF